jgi:hypothetical protein
MRIDYRSHLSAGGRATWVTRGRVELESTA